MKNFKIEYLEAYIIEKDFYQDIEKLENKIDHNSIFTSNDLAIDLFYNNKDRNLISKIEKESIFLETIAHVKDGVKVVGPAKDFAFSKTKTNNSFYPMITGKNISQYFLIWNDLYCCRDKKQIEKHHATDIRLRENFIFNSRKIVVRKTGNKIIAALDNSNYYFEQTLFGILLKDSKCLYDIKFILGILNSKIATYLLKSEPFSKKGTFPQIRLHWLKKLPIKKIEFKNDNTLKQYRNILSLVDQMLESQQKFHNAKSQSDKNLLEQKISLIDKKINELVYQLYGLSEDEIKIVENLV